MALATERRVDELFESIMVRHYDPCYVRSTGRNYEHKGQAVQLALPSLGAEGLIDAVRDLVEQDRSSAN